jgi:hypothetical protein
LEPIRDGTKFGIYSGGGGIHNLLKNPLKIGNGENYVFWIMVREGILF